MVLGLLSQKKGANCQAGLWPGRQHRLKFCMPGNTSGQHAYPLPSLSKCLKASCRFSSLSTFDMCMVAVMNSS